MVNVGFFAPTPEHGRSPALFASQHEVATEFHRTIEHIIRYKTAATNLKFGCHFENQVAAILSGNWRSLPGFATRPGASPLSRPSIIPSGLALLSLIVGHFAVSAHRPFDGQPRRAAGPTTRPAPDSDQRSAPLIDQNDTGEVTTTPPDRFAGE